LAAVIFFSWGGTNNPLSTGGLPDGGIHPRVSEQRESYHTNVEKGRKNRAIPLIWRHFFNVPKSQAIQPFVTVVLYADYSLGG
jgi:hypothetical protein